MKITCLTENLAYRNGLKSEHGVSYYIETKYGAYLFDTGKSDIIINNSKILNIDLSNIKAVFLSHGHDDHAGGLYPLANDIFKDNKRRLYLGEFAFAKRYSSRFNKLRDISIPENDKIRELYEVIEIKDNLYLNDNNFFIFKVNNLLFPDQISNKHLLIEKENGNQPDLFEDEIYLLIKENNKNVLFSGCSHRGIINVIEYLEVNNIYIDYLIGGFHTIENPSLTEKISIYFQNKKGIRIFTNHCTGIEEYAYLKNYLIDKISYFYCGKVIEV